MQRASERAHCTRACGPGGRRHQSGAALAEFAVVAILVWVLLAGILDLGRATAAQQILQNAAGSAARELSLLELPPLATFADGRGAIFDAGFLVADRELLARCEVGTELTFANVEDAMDKGGAGNLNRLLLPLWIRDVVAGNEVLRYPGAVLQRSTAGTGCESGSQYTVQIPELGSDGDLEWSEVVEFLPMDGSGGDPFPFPGGGWASIRVLYPFQAAGLQAWRDGRMVEATDPTSGPPQGGYAFVDTQASGAYAGPYGLGVLYAMDRQVRPFRRVLSAGAAFRREVFGPGTVP